MHLQKLTNYRPGYPKKALRSAALTAAALVAIGGATGCRKGTVSGLRTQGVVAMPEPTEYTLVLDWEVAIDEPEPTEDPALRLDGMVAMPEPTEEPVTTDGMVAMPEPTEECLILDGEELIEEP